MIGYKVIARNQELGYFETYSGWFEGDPKIERKAKEAAAKYGIKQILKQGASLIVGGTAGSVVKVADIISKPLQGLGSAAGEFIAEKLKLIHIGVSSQNLNFCDIEVNLMGDFEGAYLIKESEDLKGLPILLAMIPHKDSDDEFMGESVLESAFFAQVNFAKYLGNMDSFKFNFNKQAIYKLDVEINL